MLLISVARRFFALVSILPILCLRPALANPEEEPPRYRVSFADASPEIDGRLDEPAWKEGPPLDLVHPWEQQTGPRTKTEARLLWDSACLYVGYECEDTDVVAHYEDRDDPVYEEDCVEIFINPNPEKTKHYYGLEMSANAVLYDYFYCFPDTILKKLDLNGVRLATEVRGTLNASGDTDEGWSLEAAIPFECFRDVTAGEGANGGSVVPDAGTVWRIQVNRWEGTDPDRSLSMWVPSGLDVPHPHVPDRFGFLVFEK